MCFFISVSFHKDAEFICLRTCVSYLQIISTTQFRKTAICQTKTIWLDKRLKESISPPVEICKTISGRYMLDKQNDDCNWDSTGRREFSIELKLAQGVCIDRGEKIFRRPFRHGSRVGNSCFNSMAKYIENSSVDLNRGLKPIAITKVTPRLFITAKQAKWFRAVVV